PAIAPRKKARSARRRPQTPQRLQRNKYSFEHKGRPLAERRPLLLSVVDAQLGEAERSAFLAEEINGFAAEDVEALWADDGLGGREAGPDLARKDLHEHFDEFRFVQGPAVPAERKLCHRGDGFGVRFNHGRLE